MEKYKEKYEDLISFTRNPLEQLYYSLKDNCSQEQKEAFNLLAKRLKSSWRLQMPKSFVYVNIGKPLQFRAFEQSTAPPGWIRIDDLYNKINLDDVFKSRFTEEELYEIKFKYRFLII